MRHLLTLLCLFLAPVFALGVPPVDVQITTEPAVTVKIERRTGNSSKTIYLTVNQQDTVAVRAPAPPPVDHSMTGPVVDMSKIPPPAVGYSGARITDAGSDPSVQPVPDTIGAFRLPCDFSHMAKDDPIVYPGQPGKSHLHTFFGNTATSAASTAESIATTGNSTCAGGTLNRTAYWMPSVIDTRDGTPVVPVGAIIYYKTGYLGNRPETIQPMPAGLRMIAGSAKNTDPATASGWFVCMTDTSVGDKSRSIPACPVGGVIEMSVDFPQCWDGVNLDSPSHNAQMSDPEHIEDASGARNQCPASHPVVLPVVTINAKYAVHEAGETARWRLASDMYDAAQPAGYSAHADWYMGWDKPTMQTWVDNCEHRSLDCHGYLLGNGQMLF